MDAGQPKRRELRGKYIWLAAVIFVLTGGAIGGLWLLGGRKSADERLAEIETARAVPDAENAALIYNELLQDPRAASLLDARPDIWTPPSILQKRTEPWRAEECPELAAWIEGCAPIIAALAEASQLNTCRFRITIDIFDTSIIDRTAPMCLWAILLTFAANNDLGEGHPDAAITKWRCIIQLSNHLRQQPSAFDHMAASVTTELALRPIARFLATGDLSPQHLQEIEAIPLPLADDWQHHLEQIRLIDDLTTRKTNESVSLWRRLTSTLSPHRMKRVIKRVFAPDEESLPETIGRRYRQNIAAAQGLRILVALRRHRSETGQWPESLDEISSSLSQTILIDPLNGGAFVYRRTTEAFELYSKGKNKTDETVGRGMDHGDDWPIWPPREPAAQRKQTDANGV